MVDHRLVHSFVCIIPISGGSSFSTSVYVCISGGSSIRPSLHQFIDSIRRHKDNIGQKKEVVMIVIKC